MARCSGFKPEEIVEAFLWPKRHVKLEFVAWRFRMADGRTVQGYKRSETAANIDVFDPTTQKTESLTKNVIAPDPELRAVYDDISLRYPELYAATSEIVHELEELPAR